MSPGFTIRDAAQYLMAELDRQAAEAGRVVNGPVSIFERTTTFERIIRIEADTKAR